MVELKDYIGWIIAILIVVVPLTIAYVFALRVDITKLKSESVALKEVNKEMRQDMKSLADSMIDSTKTLDEKFTQIMFTMISGKNNE